MDLTPSHEYGNSRPLHSDTHFEPKQKQKSAVLGIEHGLKNRDSLIKINCNGHISKFENFSIGLVNCQSLRNKTEHILDTISSNRFSMMFLTETWIQENGDELHLGHSTPNGYYSIHRSRSTGKRGGGLGVILQDSIKTVEKSSDFPTYNSFELLAIESIQNGLPVRYYLIYRPPPSASNGIVKSQFLPEFTNFLESIVVRSEHFYILGDFNIPWDSLEDPERKGFASLLSSFGLIQHIEDQTHARGHTIDFLISKKQDHIIVNYTVGELISDHNLICAYFNFSKPQFLTREIKYRKFKAIDHETFSQDIIDAGLIPSSCDNLQTALDKYSQVLGEILDKHAPEKRTKITIRPRQPWYDTDIKIAKQAKRKSERKWRSLRRKLFKTQNSFERTVVSQKVEKARLDYISKRTEFVKCLRSAKETYYVSKIEQCGSNQKQLFVILNELTNKKRSPTLPEHSSEEELVEKFNSFFIGKIRNIRKELDSIQSNQCFNEKASVSHLDKFDPCTENELNRIIMNASNASCELDPIPTSLLKKCLPTLLPYLTHIVNLSLESGHFPDTLKKAIVRPLLKKPSLDRNNLKNFRPVSNIAFLSKIIEKVVVKRLDTYMSANDLNETYQSAYRRNHGTETALVKIHDDILRALDQKNGVVLVMLDLSAAFDTIDHDILLERFRRRLGVDGDALNWLREYHKGRTQATVINSTQSEPQPLDFGAPQGSIMGPEDYKAYTLPVGEITRQHNMKFHGYADDSNNYVSFRLDHKPHFESAISSVEQCTTDIKAWMTSNKLKLNDEKTEVLVIVPPTSSRKYPDRDVKIADATVRTTKQAKGLGVIFDRNMTLAREIENRCRTLIFHLRNIRTIRRFITQSACEKLVHALVSSRLDYANAILAGLPQTKLKQLQSIQNIAARIVTQTPKFEHITPVLRKLHWLPINARIEFKVICLTFRIINGNAPVYMRDLVSEKHSTRSLRSTNKRLLNIPKTRTKMYGDRAFSAIAPRLWNELPQSLRGECNFNVFKRNLKTHLFKKVYCV